MVLLIRAGEKDKIEVALLSGGEALAREKISAPFSQAEKLLPLIDKILRENRLKPRDIEKIRVADKGESFTALRIGVVTANALAYAWQIPVEPEKGRGVLKFGEKKFNIVKPAYGKKPNITVKKR